MKGALFLSCWFVPFVANFLMLEIRFSLKGEDIVRSFNWKVLSNERR
jgi:hypothetical protein